MLSFSQFTQLNEATLDDIKRGIANRHKQETGHEPDPAELHDVVTKAKKIPGLDIGKHSFNELKDKVDPGIKLIHHNPDTGVSIHEVTRKDACVKGYGHGKTNWCVAATGEGNEFEKYGQGGKRFFTIHEKDPITKVERVYGVHEHEKGVIRGNRNNPITKEAHPNILKAMAQTPQMKKVNLMMNNPLSRFSKKDLSHALEDSNPDVRNAAQKRLESGK